MLINLSIFKVIWNASLCYWNFAEIYHFQLQEIFHKRNERNCISEHTNATFLENNYIPKLDIVSIHPVSLLFNFYFVKTYLRTWLSVIMSNSGPSKLLLKYFKNSISASTLRYLTELRWMSGFSSRKTLSRAIFSKHICQARILVIFFMHPHDLWKAVTSWYVSVWGLIWVQSSEY